MTKASEAQRYELMVIISSELNQNETKKALDTVCALIESKSGKIVHQDLWGRREFAYKLKGQNEGYYAVIFFTADGKDLLDIDFNLRIDRNVLRHLLSKMEKNEQPRDYAEVLANIPSRPVRVQERGAKRDDRRPEAPRAAEPVKAAMKKENLDEKLDALLDGDLA